MAKRLVELQIRGSEDEAGDVQKKKQKTLEESEENEAIKVLSRPVALKAISGTLIGKSSAKRTGARKGSPGKAKLSPVKSPNRSAKTPLVQGGFPWNGKSFVVTGLFRNFASRDDIVHSIQKNGGRVVSAVSGRTDYLVAGHILEDGRETKEGRKYQAALERQVTILKEDDFSKLLQDAEAISSKIRQSEAPEVECLSAPVKRVADSALWVDKYKPAKLEDLVGNGSYVMGLRKWLESWNDVHLFKRRKAGFSKDNVQAKAALLSGPPGIGKSTAAAMIAKSLGFDVVELNASDSRSTRAVESQLGNAIDGQVIGTKGGKRLIIMDEVDGMSGADRGGVAKLIQLIKKCKVPIICICNDRQKSSVRSLANHCYDLKFRRPNADAVSNRVAQIAKLEGMNVEPAAVRQLVVSQGGDVRQVINALQMWRRQDTSLTYDKWLKRSGSISKDDTFKLSNFDACGYIFNAASAPDTFDKRFAAYFVDYDLIPLMIQDNYIAACKTKRESEIDKLRRLSAAADACCDADEVRRKVNGFQHWGLLPQVAALNVRIGSITEGNVGFPGFPQWLGKNSSRGKKRRLISDTAMHMRSCTHGISSLVFRLDYLCTLRDRLLKPLIDGDLNGINATIDLLDAYGLDRDDLFETMQEVDLNSNASGDKSGNSAKESEMRNSFSAISSTVKAAFTRKYNERSHKSQILVSEMGIVGMKKKSKAKVKDEIITGSDEESADVEELDDAALKALGSKAKKRSKKAPSKKISKKTAR